MIKVQDQVRAHIFDEHVEQYHVDYRVRDEKGRAIGCIITINKETRLEDEFSSWLSPRELMGVHYTSQVQNTRDGVSFGALAPRKFHYSLGAARDDAMGRADRSKKRFLRKFT